MTFSYQEYKSSVLGQRIDYDHRYGYQCVDLIDDLWCKLGYPIAYCSTSGYAKDIWEQRKTNGVLKNHTEVSVMQPGDIAVFREVPGVTPLSHIAIFDSDAGNGYGWYLGQNQGASHVNVVKLPYSATYATALRPNCWKVAKPTPAPTTTASILNAVPSDFIREHATFYPNTTIKIRRAPSLAGEDTGLVYKPGMSVIYDGYVKREGYVWISWISSANAQRRWMACGELNRAGVNVKPYGTFK